MEQMIVDEIVRLLVAAIIFVPPLWKIFSKAGFSPWCSLLVLIPPFGVGVLIVALVLGYRKWPAGKEV
jgi:hypothetical protein